MAESETITGTGSVQGRSSRTPDRLTLAAFGLFILLAGGAPIAVRFTYAELAPYWDDIQAFLSQAASAVAAAEQALSDATVQVGYANEDRISFNRRLRRRDGTTQMNWEALQPGFDASAVVGPWGPADPELICLSVRREQRPVAAIVHFGLHPAILAGDNWLYSADYPGYLAVRSDLYARAWSKV